MKNLKEEEKSNIIYICFALLAILGIVLSLPSIFYLFNNKTIDGYEGQDYYFIGNNSFKFAILGTIIFGAIIILSYIIYFKILKNSDKLKNLKTIMILIAIVSIIFGICLPNTSTDVFYYMGTGKLVETYGQNPYYITADDVLNSGISDTTLENVGYWSDTVAVYGPLWVTICAIFSKISLGFHTLYLYIFKFFSLLVHLMICLLIYKLTRRKKFVLMYGINPFILLEFLTNVHNDIYLIFFALLSIYFMKNKRNIWLSLVFLACSILIKYVTAIFAPFIVLYYLKDNRLLSKILHCIIYASFVILIVFCIYFIFFNDLSDLVNILIKQQTKIKDSIYLTMYFAGYSFSAIFQINYIFTFFFAVIFILCIIKLLIKKLSFNKYMKYFKNVLLIFIFLVLTNLTSWYLSWLFIPIFWLRSKDIKDVLFLQLFYELTYLYSFIINTEYVTINFLILPTMCIAVIYYKMITFK